ncbi:hypothetical protein Taro_010854 [Colocasia esculenta]|uniref:Uncharacterized protein n=1 Tax=Colocasia esculenta TaxID=4460 RepID=A0A843U9E1_COLES|nr:hypothetical protein [Colocasia esculenta]
MRGWVPYWASFAKLIPPLTSFQVEFVGAGARVRTVCVVPLVVCSVVVQQDSSGSRRRVAVVVVLCTWCVIASWFVPLVLLMMELLVEVFLVRKTVVDRSGAVLLVIVGCAFGCMCSVVAERVFPELFLACSGGGFSQNSFVLVSVLLPSELSQGVVPLTVCLAAALVSCLVVRFDSSRLHWWDCVCPRSSDGPAPFSCAHRAVAAGDVVCVLAMWLAVFLVEVLVSCFDPLSCVRKRPAVHFVLSFVGCLG